MFSPSAVSIPFDLRHPREAWRADLPQGEPCIYYQLVYRSTHQLTNFLPSLYNKAAACFSDRSPSLWSEAIFKTVYISMLMFLRIRTTDSQAIFEILCTRVVTVCVG